VPPRRWTDEALSRAVPTSQNLNQLCAALGVAAGAQTYALLRRHIERLGLDASHMPVVERPRRRRQWSDDDLRAAVRRNTTVSSVLRDLGYRPSGGMHRYIRATIASLGIDTSHFVGRSWAKGRRYTARKRPLSEILVRGSGYTNSARLRERLIAEGLKQARCEHCGLDSWQGAPLPLALDHINGDPNDNRLENLRILCPNCHALTSTWCGRTRQ
jgi:hypothetical protein